jgi:O-methyltransferase
MNAMSESNDIYATPRLVSIEDCEFYHVMDLPGFGRVGGLWDLRGRVNEYLGHVDLKAKRVLEIGPASGFLTIEMERSGADVVAVEVPDDPGWDFVPYPPHVLDPARVPRANQMRRIKNSFWFAHAAHNATAKLFYGNVYDLPNELGAFDLAVMAAVLLHTRDPLAIIEQCAKRAKTLVITDLLYPDMEGSPICRLSPTRENKFLDTWWEFSTMFLTQFINVLGYNCCDVTTHFQTGPHGPWQYFTIVASNKNGARARL